MTDAKHEPIPETVVDGEFSSGDEDTSAPWKHMEVGQSHSIIDTHVKKVITVAGQGSEFPSTGDKVTVHYTGTLLSDGSKFDSSRDRDDPFVFTLGQGVIEGWSVGVATMKLGERATFTLSPEYAYGSQGSPPKIPASAVLVFDIELLSWKSESDINGDGSVVMKKRLTEGTGFEKPRENSEVIICLTATAEGADVPFITDETTNHMIKPGCTGSLSTGVEQAVRTMKAGEKRLVEISSSKLQDGYPSAPEGASKVILELKLVHFAEIQDVSMHGDKSVTMKLIRTKAHWKRPKDGAVLTMSFCSFDDFKAGKVPEASEYTMGSAAMELPLPVERALEQMGAGDGAEVVVKGAAGAEDEVLYIDLVSFVAATEAWECPPEKKLEIANEKKAAAAELFKAKHFLRAAAKYSRALEYLTDSYSNDEEEKAVSNALKAVIQTNIATCYVKLSNWKQTKLAADKAIDADSSNAKAYARRATSEMRSSRFAAARADLNLAETHGLTADALASSRALCDKLETKHAKKQAKLLKKMMSG